MDLGGVRILEAEDVAALRLQAAILEVGYDTLGDMPEARDILHEQAQFLRVAGRTRHPVAAATRSTNCVRPWDALASVCERVGGARIGCFLIRVA